MTHPTRVPAVSRSAFVGTPHAAHDALTLEAPSRHRDGASAWLATSRLLRRACASTQWRVVVWWFFALLSIAVVSKYLETGWGASPPMRSGPARTAAALHAFDLLRRCFAIYRADFIETAAVLLLVSATALLPRVRLSAVAWISITAAAGVAFAEWLALHQTGEPLTYANIMISIDWAWQHPDVIPAVVSWKGIGLASTTAIGYGAVPSLTGHLSFRQGPLGRFARRVTDAAGASAAGLVALALLTPGPVLPTLSQHLNPTDGYWSSSLASLIDIDVESPDNLPRQSRAALRADYDRITYPAGRPTQPVLLDVALGARGARHVVLVVLETAPRRFYPITTDSSFHTFSAMRANAIVTDHHFTTRPATLFAIYSMLTGTYPRPGGAIGDYGPFRDDGLATTLGCRGYESTYIDSFRVDWGYHYRDELRLQGFGSIIDSAGFRAPPGDSYSTALARERWSFQQAEQAIRGASAHRRKAFVVVATTLGHFPWRAPDSAAHEPSVAKLDRMAHALDGVVGGFVRGLDSLGMRDSVIVVVTGDHGLRYTSEFASVGDGDRAGDVDFNVPFMLYAPGLIRRTVQLPYATSHIDIAPTLYYLLGIPADSLLLNGDNMLDRRLANRATFLMNTGLYPVDGFELGRRRFRVNSITGQVQVTPTPAAAAPRPAWSDDSSRALVTTANHLFNRTAAYFHQHAGARCGASPD